MSRTTIFNPFVSPVLIFNSQNELISAALLKVIINYYGENDFMNRNGMEKTRVLIFSSWYICGILLQ
jgi:hypothetical protein